MFENFAAKLKKMREAKGEEENVTFKPFPEETEAKVKVEEKAEEPKKLLPTLGESEGTGFEGHEFFEASSIRKIGGKYYLVYSSVTLHELCYAVSDKPDEGFVYGGVVVSNADIFP